MAEAKGDGHTWPSLPWVLRGALVLHTILFVAAWTHNSRLPYGHAAYHLAQAYRFSNELGDFLQGEATLAYLFRNPTPYPQLVHVGGGIAAFLTSNASFGPFVVTFALFLISIVLVYVLSIFLGVSRRAAILAALIYSLLPGVVLEGHVFALDAPMTAGVFLAWAFFAKHQRSGQRRDLWLACAAAALAQSLKWTAVLFLGVPFLVSLLAAARARRITAEMRASFAVALSGLVTLALYILIEGSRFAEIANPAFHGGAVARRQAIFLLLPDPGVLQYYASTLVQKMTGVVPACLALFGAVALGRYRPSVALVSTAMLLVPFVAFSMLSVMDGRYLLPALFPIALSIGYFLSLRRMWVQIGAVLVISGLLTAAKFAYHFGESEQELLARIISGPGGEDSALDFFENFAVRREHVSWEPVLEFIAQHSQGAPTTGVIATYEASYGSLSTFEMLKHQKRYRNLYMPIPYYGVKFGSATELLAFLKENNVTYAVVSPHPEATVRINRVTFEDLRTYFLSHQNERFEVVREFLFEDGESILVYHRRDRDVPAVRGTRCYAEVGRYLGWVQLDVEPGREYVFYAPGIRVAESLQVPRANRTYIVRLTSPRATSIRVEGIPPEHGASLCDNINGSIDLSEAGRATLANPNSCGVKPCDSVKVMDWSLSGMVESKILHQSDQKSSAVRSAGE